MKALKNVSLSFVDLSLKSLKFLSDLKTLELIDCNLIDISSLKHLARLEILSLRDSLFDEFPKELGALTELRLLDLRNCSQLKRIPSNVISRFSQLEELYVDDYFDEREDEETSTEGSNASLSELNSLSNLVVLFLKINAKCLSRLGFLLFATNCKEYLAIQSCNKLEEIFQLDGLCHSREENVAMLSSLAELDLKELPQLRFAQSLVQLKSLEVSDCESLKHLIVTEEVTEEGDNDKEEEILPESHHAAIVLPNLEKLSIGKLPQLRCIWSGPSYHVKLPSLTDVGVRECKTLIYLFTLSVAQSLVQLKSLEVSDCESLEHLVITEEGDNDEISSEHDLQIHSPFLSKLESLKINSCERLEHIFPVSFARVLVQLEEFAVENAPQLKQVFYLDNGSEENVVAGDGKETANLRILRIGSWNQLYDTLLSGLKDGFFKNLEELKLEGLCSKSPTLVLSLENLTTLDLYHCDRLRNIFSPSLAQNLSQLQVLNIYDCGELEEIIVEEDEENQILFFQNLLEIIVVRCPKIRRLFAITVAPRLQKLGKIYVYDNSELEEVFGDKDVADVMDHKEIVLPQLGWLYLGNYQVSPRCPKMSTRFSMGEDRCVHAKAKPLKMGNQDQIAEFPSEPSIDILCWGFHQIKERLPLYIGNDEQSINQKEEERFMLMIANQSIHQLLVEIPQRNSQILKVQNIDYGYCFC
ncbi:hypothetical protein Patl1_04199 [Pistacia atlantica]|uniref:Uncharacterized protein n=1 Tax=Pistacia atlantica TaxID=434234 RepID=A0ACC1BSH8_9ROSI|nr:hypothetical protein Patl1_04199 [Pistacia atlantica]